MIVRDQREWVLTYASANLHPDASLDEFTTRLGDRLLAVSDGPELRVTIVKTVRDLVRDQNRTVERREYRFSARAQSSVDEVVDTSRSVEHRLISQSEALAILSRISIADRKLVRELYGIGVNELPREQIARELGLSRNTLDQRIRRLLKAMRLF